jgi:hypothetical protein
MYFKNKEKFGKMRNIVLILGNDQRVQREKVSVPALVEIRHAESM